MKSQCHQASKYAWGQGLKEGINRSSSVRGPNRCKDLAKRAFVLVLLSGATLTEELRFSLGMVASGQCMRCGADSETMRHCIYECADNSSINVGGSDCDDDGEGDQGIIRRTEYLEREAKSPQHEWPCFYSRGGLFSFIISANYDLK